VVQRQHSKRIRFFLNFDREMAEEQRFAEVHSNNNFPTAAGLPSSSAGYAALALSTSRAAGLDLNPSDLSLLARRGSGSAARSIQGGFVELLFGKREDGRDAKARPIGDKRFWPICIMIAITAKSPKVISSRDGMRLTSKTSPYYKTWIKSTQIDLPEMRTAILARDITKVGELTERSCLKMHGAMLSTEPGIIYWNGGTISVIEAVKDLRAQGHPVYFTIDAGPQVKTGLMRSINLHSRPGKQSRITI
jgi:diphosphomevalonate decarboxylase